MQRPAAVVVGQRQAAGLEARHLDQGRQGLQARRAGARPCMQCMHQGVCHVNTTPGRPRVQREPGGEGGQEVHI